MTFPVDDVTLAMLEASCDASNNDDGMSHLAEFLSFGAEPLEPYVTEDGDEIPIYAGGYHHTDVILALVAEIRRLRTRPEDS